MSGMQFAEPGWLWLALAAPVLLVTVMRYAAWARQRQLQTLASAQRLPELTRSHSRSRRAIKNILLVLVAILMGIALARPQWGVQEFAIQEIGEDLVFAIDCSRSMLAADVSPNRLERGKLAVIDFVRRHPEGRIGLVAFAGQAFLQCPLTFDHEAFEESLRDLDERTIAVPGTDLGRALQEAFQAMEKKSRRKTVVLLTDGEDLEQSGIRVGEALARENVVVFTIGVGTEAGAEIRVLNEQNQPEMVRDAQGQPVRSRMDEQTLKRIASVTRGAYFPLGALGEGLAKVQLAMQKDEASGANVPVRRLGIDRYHWFVGLVLLLLVAESLIGTRRHLNA
ncbi:MAG TPA: VWA domain-containing protein [Verrucomicrobiae bacterium]|nr:VWA domain-containing protein [Verrucomicrobiae bacterium]